jgi:hypothetical protein
MLHNPGGWHSTHIEFLYLEDNKEMTIGEKRNILYACSQGLYSVQWDSDDFMKEDAIKLIMERINPDKTLYKGDCITYGEYCSIDGQYFLSNHSIFYGEWEGDGQRLLEDGYHYHRTPFFKSVIKTEICQAVQVPAIRWNEDEQWANAIKPLLTSEVHIPEYLYLYNHVSSNPEERYGLNRTT